MNFELKDYLSENQDLTNEVLRIFNSLDDTAIVAQLKDLTAEKKSLEAKVYKSPKALSAADLMGGEEA